MDKLPKKSKKSFPFMEDLMQQDEYRKLDKYKKKMDKDDKHQRSKIKESFKREKSDKQTHKSKDRKELNHRDRYKKSSSKYKSFKDCDSDSCSDTSRRGGSTSRCYYDNSSSFSNRKNRNSDRNRYDRHYEDTRAHDSVSSKKYDDRTSHHKSYHHQDSNEKRYRHETVSPRQNTFENGHSDTDCWDIDCSNEAVVCQANKNYKLADKCSQSSYREDYITGIGQSTAEESSNSDKFAEHMKSGRKFILKVLQNTSNEPLDTSLDENIYIQKIAKSKNIEDEAPNIDIVRQARDTIKQEPIDYNRYEAFVDENNLERQPHHVSDFSQFNIPETIRSKDPRLKLQAMRSRTQNESLQSHTLSTLSPDLSFRVIHPSVRNSQISYPDHGLQGTPMGISKNSTQRLPYWNNILPQSHLTSHPMMVPPVTAYNTKQANVLHQLSVSSTYTSSTHQPYQKPLNINNECRQLERQNYDQSHSARRAPLTYGEYLRSRASETSTSGINGDDTSNRSTNISQLYLNANPIPTVVKNSKGFENFKIPKTTAVTKGTVSQVNGNKNNEFHSYDKKDAPGSFKSPSQPNDSADKQLEEENTKKFLKELFNPNNLRALVNFIGEVTEVNNVDVVKEILEKREKGTKESASFVKMDNVPSKPKDDMEKIRNHGHSMFRKYSVLKTSGERTPSSSYKFIKSKTEDDVVIEDKKRRIPRSSTTVGEASDTTTPPDEPLAKRVKPSNTMGNEKLNQTIKNNNPEWHSLNTTMNCSICDRPKGRSLVSHYVNDHPDIEVHTSRIPPMVAKRIHDPKHRSEYEIIQLQGTEIEPKLKQFCYFCNTFKCLRKYNWITHLSVHTGYYRFKCIDCSRKFAVKNRDHVCKKKNNVEKILLPQFQKETIMGYICDLCNYVRFNETEIEQHLHSEHEANVKKSFKEVVFLQLPKSRQKVKEDPEESENDSYGSETDDDNTQHNTDKNDVNGLKERKLARVNTVCSSSTPEFLAETNKTLKTIANLDELANKEMTTKRSVCAIEDLPNSDTITIKSESVIKNNNRDFHSLATNIKCQICDVPNRKSIVNHYVNFHTDSEVLTSRLAPEVADSLRSLTQFDDEKSQPRLNDKIKGYDTFEQFCYFCNKYKCYSQYSWIEHCVKHTGYYQYKCSDCGLKFVRNDTNHVCKLKNNVVKVFQPQFSDEKVIAYICDVCNYVRFLEFEIQQHLQSEHDGNCTNSFKKVIFLRLPRNIMKKQVAENENDDSHAPESVDVIKMEASNAIETSAAVPTEDKSRENNHQQEPTDDVASWESFSDSDYD